MDKGSSKHRKEFKLYLGKSIHIGPNMGAGDLNLTRCLIIIFQSPVGLECLYQAPNAHFYILTASLTCVNSVYIMSSRTKQKNLWLYQIIFGIYIYILSLYTQLSYIELNWMRVDHLHKSWSLIIRLGYGLIKNNN